MHEKRLATGLGPGTQGGGLTTLPRPLAGFKGAASQQRREGKEGTKGRVITDPPINNSWPKVCIIKAGGKVCHSQMPF